MLRAISILAKRSRKVFWRMMTHLVRRDRGLLIIDPHGDFAEEFAQQSMYYADFKKNPHNPDLIYIDPFLTLNRNMSGTMPSINPFVWHRKPNAFEMEKRAQQLAEVFSSLVFGGNAELSGNMETFLLPCLYVLLSRKNSTLRDLKRFMRKETNHDLVALGKELPNPDHRSFFEYSFSVPRYDATKEALASRIQYLLNTTVFARFASSTNSTFDLEKALNSGKSVIVNCSSGKLGQQVMKAIGKLFIGLALAIAFNRAAKNESDRTPVWLVLDEMHNFVSRDMETIITQTRKYGLHLVLASQVVGQGMNKERTEIIMGNTAVKIVGNTGSGSLSAMANDMFLKRENFADLDVGQFVVKSGIQKPRKTRMSQLYVVSRWSKKENKPRGLHEIPDRERKRMGLMTKAQWEEIVKFQVKKYYRHQRIGSTKEYRFNQNQKRSHGENDFNSEKPHNTKDLAHYSAP